MKVIFKLSEIKNLSIKTYNICASKPIEINKILDLIKKYFKINQLIRFKEKRKGEMLITYGSNKKLLKHINYNKFTPIETGLKKTIIWFKKFKNKKSLYLHK